MKADPRRTVSLFQIFTATGLLLYWIGFFVFNLVPENPPPCYFSFEGAFPFPDAVLAVFLLIAGILGLKGVRVGRTLSLASAGALVFLGLLDTSFNLQNGVYSSSLFDLVLNGLINVWAVGFGGFTIIAHNRFS